MASGHPSTFIAALESTTSTASTTSTGPNDRSGSEAAASLNSQNEVDIVDKLDTRQNANKFDDSRVQDVQAVPAGPTAPYLEVDDEERVKAAQAEEWAKAVAAAEAAEDARVKEVQQSLLEWFNHHFAFYEVGSDTRKPAIAEFTPDGDFEARRTLPDFLTALQHTNGGVVPVRAFDEKTKRKVTDYKPAATWWLRHPKHRWHSRIVLAPPGSPELPLPERTHNLWSGFAVDPVRGDWSKNRDHIFRIICDGNQQLFEWLLHWMAALVQKPGQHGWVAPMLLGGQGTGKGHFVHKTLGQLFRRRQYAHLGSADELTGSFTEHLSGKIFVFADESFWGSKAAADVLKRYITEDTVMIHPKHFPRFEEPSSLHVVIASNSEYALHIERDDRRFAVFQVSEAEKNRQSYFRALHEELHAGGWAAMLYDLLQYEVNEDWLRQPPESHAKVRMKSDSLSALDLFWLDVLQDTAAWEERVARKDLHRRMLEFYRSHGRSGPFPDSQKLGRFLATQFKLGGKPGWPHKPKTLDDARRNAWEFPSLVECRECFRKATGTDPDFGSTQLVMDFEKAGEVAEP